MTAPEDVRPDVRDAAIAVMADVGAIRFEPLAGGSSAHVARLDLESESGARRTVLFRQHADRAGKEHGLDVAAKEFHLTAILHERGFPVAEPLARHGARVEDGPWLVTEWVEGSSFETVPTDEIEVGLEQMARFLVGLHHLDVDDVDVPGLDEIEDPVEPILDLLPRIETPEPHDPGRRLRAAVVARPERRPNQPVVLHGDFWPGNVLVDHSGRLTAVIDWEDATIGDPLVDLACARVELTCAFGEPAADVFMSTYLDVTVAAGRPVDLRDLALWDVYVSVTALEGMHRWGLAEAAEAARRLATTRFLRRATERLTAT